MQLVPYRATVLESWIDYNDHLTEGYYGVVFADASDEALIQLGFGPDYRSHERGTFYTVETHVRFIEEVALGDLLRVDMRVLGADEKRLHLFHTMHHEGAGFVAATQEVMLLHVDIDDVTVRPMSASIRARAAAAIAAAAEQPFPESAGRSIRRVPSPGNITP